MRKFSLLIILFLVTSCKVFSQHQQFDTKKFGSTLIECFYTMKTLCTVPLSASAQNQIGYKVTKLGNLLQQQFNSHKTELIQKLGSTDVKELENEVQSYSKPMAINPSTGLNRQQIASLQLWLELNQSIVEDIFIKLEH
jgi:hypothetical protein